MAVALLAGYACSANKAPGQSGSTDAAPLASGGTSGGAIASGGTGATAVGGAGGAVATGAPIDAAPTNTGCTCTDSTTTWDCYCQVYDCSKTIAAFTTDAADGGAPYVLMMEYANCNLVEYETYPSEGVTVEVFDLTSGALVGRFRNGVENNVCPFGGADAPIYSLKAGRFPDSTCVRSKCVAISAVDGCYTPDAGTPPGN